MHAPVMAYPHNIPTGPNHRPKVRFATNISTAPLRLAGNLFEKLAGVELLNVPYKGASTVVTDLLGNSIQLMFTTPLSVSSYLSSGKLRALAVASSTRMASLPDIPTAAEAGLRGYESDAWYGLYGPPECERA